jgi:hypothetical protein
MSFLDRFKPQPRWKHTDPVVRAAAVAELAGDPEHQSVLAELAAEDEDVRVRRAAVAQLTSPSALVPLARRERDEDLRREIGDRLVALASAPSASEADATLALDGLEDPKQLAAVARSAAPEAVRAAALDLIQDQKALSSVARHADDPQIALAAVGRLTDPQELRAVALKTEQKDAGVAAVERALESAADDDERRELLELIATRARAKAVARRARAGLQALDESAAAQQAALEQWQRRVALILARVETLGGMPSAPDLLEQLDEAEDEWTGLGSAAFAVDPDTDARFRTLVADARAAHARHLEEEAARRQAEAELAAQRDARAALCERVEAIRGEDAPDQIAQARAAWDAIPVPGEAAAAGAADLSERFETGCAAAAARHARREEAARARARREELSVEAERLAGLDTHDEQAWTQVTEEWRALEPQADGVDEAAAQRFAAAGAAVAAKQADEQAAADRTLRQHLQRLDQLVERVNKRAAAEDLTLREADRAARDLKAAIDAPPPLDDGERAALVERLKAAQAVLAPRLRELHEMDEWKRFANAAVQEELIARTEGLASKYHFDAEGGPTPEDVEHASRELREIHERWKQVAEAPRAQAQALWHRYRQAADPIQARAREFFAGRAEERQANLARKLALIERAEALADSTDWVKTADELKKLQQEWQQIGPVPRPDTRTTWKRFRDACDRFFSRRNADLAERKETWAANLARKEALCVRAEELATSREWERAASEIRRLQAEWKTIGPVRRNKSEAVWQRFRTACDTFFDRYKRRDEIEIEAKQADREALVREMETMAQGAADPAAPEDLLELVRGLRSRWNQTTPVVRHGADPLSARFMEALAGVIAAAPDRFRGTELDVEASRQKMEKLCARVEGLLAAAPAAPANSSQALADMLREALASNTIGGRGGDEARWRAMGEEVRQAQAAWSRLGPVPGQAGRDLADRFHKACNRFFEQQRRHVPPQPAGRRRELQVR